MTFGKRQHRVVFEKIQVNARKCGKCGCGVYRNRSKTFWQTCSPFNRNADGTPKTHEQIRAELHAQAERWRAEPVECKECER